jgi:hypothetical protein
MSTKFKMCRYSLRCLYRSGPPDRSPRVQASPSPPTRTHRSLPRSCLADWGAGCLRAFPGLTSFRIRSMVAEPTAEGVLSPRASA